MDEMNDQVLGVFAILLLAGLVAVVIYVQIRRAQTLLQGWAEENGYEVLEAEHRLFRKGPYVWSARGQAIYRVRVRDRGGVERRGWLRCGTWWGGVFADKVESRWDEV
jgi:hypothetical protein